MPNIKSYLFFTCEDCEKIKAERLAKIERERNEWLEAQRLVKELQRKQFEEKERVRAEKSKKEREAQEVASTILQVSVPITITSAMVKGGHRTCLRVRVCVCVCIHTHTNVRNLTIIHVMTP